MIYQIMQIVSISTTGFRPIELKKHQFLCITECLSDDEPFIEETVRVGS